MAEPQKKKAKTGRPLEHVSFKTLVRRVIKELDERKTIVPVAVTANITKKG